MKLDKNRLSLELARACLTITELCAKAGVPYPSLAPVLAGKYDPKPKTVGKLARALGVDVTELLEQEAQP